jgi:hypothetical protein
MSKPPNFRAAPIEFGLCGTISGERRYCAERR